MDAAHLSETAKGIARWRTAIPREELSRPVRLALSDGLLVPGITILDYGCGRGDDVRLLEKLGFRASGWDPHYACETPLRQSAVVNLGYVLNVIEDLEERVEALTSAWNYAHRVLIVSAQVTVDDHLRSKTAFQDGHVTSKGTFQKFYEQKELKDFIESVCGEDAFAAGIGVYYVFRDPELRHFFLASRYTRRSAKPRVPISQLRFEQHRELLEALIDCISELGRVPERDEFNRYGEIEQTLGSVNRAFRTIRRVTGQEQWDTVALERRDDVLVLLALMRFGRRPDSPSKLPLRFQRDVRAFCGSYKSACEAADTLLFGVGDQHRLAAAMKSSPVGKLTPTALYVHECAIPQLSPALRIYEACARNFVGLKEPGTVVKLHRREPAVSYLFYPTFLEDAHPALTGSIHVGLRPLEVAFRDYSRSDNPPILHRKELFIGSDHPDHARFAALTKQEEDAGLLADSRAIGNRTQWFARLNDRALTITDHQLLTTNRLDPQECTAGDCSGRSL